MIVYLHGFNSAPASFKAGLVGDELARRGRGNEFVCPALPWRFRDAQAVIDTTLQSLTGRPVCLVGSSLGGFYATFFAEKYSLPAVLVNPAVLPFHGLANYLGAQRNLYTGEEYVLEAGHIDELLALDVPLPTRPERYLLLVRTGDEVLDYREAVMKFATSPQVAIQGGDHAFYDFADYVGRVIDFADAHAAAGIMPARQSQQS